MWCAWIAIVSSYSATNRQDNTPVCLLLTRADRDASSIRSPHHACAGIPLHAWHCRRKALSSQVADQSCLNNEAEHQYSVRRGRRATFPATRRHFLLARPCRSRAQIQYILVLLSTIARRVYRGRTFRVIAHVGSRGRANWPCARASQLKSQASIAADVQALQG